MDLPEDFHRAFMRAAFEKLDAEMQCYFQRAVVHEIGQSVVKSRFHPNCKLEFRAFVIYLN